LLREDLQATSSTHLTESEDKWSPREDQDDGQTWNYFKTALFGHVLKKSTHSLFSAWAIFLVHICFTLREGPKAFKTKFLRSRTMEVGPWTRTIGKGPLSWPDFMGHSVNRPLVMLNVMHHCCMSKFLIDISLHFGVNVIISFQKLVGNLDMMTIANLRRQHQRSLNSYFKIYWEYLYFFGVISYYFTQSTLLKLIVYIYKLVLLMFLYSLDSTTNLRHLSY
jgi:hypothetical protein